MTPPSRFFQQGEGRFQQMKCSYAEQGNFWEPRCLPGFVMEQSCPYIYITGPPWTLKNKDLGSLRNLMRLMSSKFFLMFGNREPLDGNISESKNCRFQLFLKPQRLHSSFHLRIDKFFQKFENCNYIPYIEVICKVSMLRGQEGPIFHKWGDKTSNGGRDSNNASWHGGPACLII